MATLGRSKKSLAYIEGIIGVYAIVFTKITLSRKSTVYPPTVAFAFTRIMLILEESSIPRSKHSIPFRRNAVVGYTLVGVRL